MRRIETCLNPDDFTLILEPSDGVAQAWGDYGDAGLCPEQQIDLSLSDISTANHQRGGSLQFQEYRKRIHTRESITVLKKKVSPTWGMHE